MGSYRLQPELPDFRGIKALRGLLEFRVLRDWPETRDLKVRQALRD
jgi:hypothetical protein